MTEQPQITATPEQLVAQGWVEHNNDFVCLYCICVVPNKVIRNEEARNLHRQKCNDRNDQ